MLADLSARSLNLWILWACIMLRLSVYYIFTCLQYKFQYIAMNWGGIVQNYWMWLLKRGSTLKNKCSLYTCLHHRYYKVEMPFTAKVCSWIPWYRAALLDINNSLSSTPHDWTTNSYGLYHMCHTAYNVWYVHCCTLCMYQDIVCMHYVVLDLYLFAV